MGDEKAKTVVEEEPKIPVFTVLKNGAILKNIFIVNKPPPPPHSEPISSVHQETEEILIVGRHPDCNIVLTHPSVSRFHLQILSNPSSHKLFLTDLSSVHGTWISEKRIEPGVRVELRQGDTLRVGASSRLYRLHWIPLSHAYEQDALRVLNCLPVETAEPDCSDMNFEGMESLFSDDNMGLIQPPVPRGGDQSEQGVDNSSEDDCEEKKMCEIPEIDQVVNILPIEKAEFESTESISEVIESLVCGDNLGIIGRKEIPSAPPMPEEEDRSEHGGENSSKVVGQENVLSSFWAFGTESVNLFFPREDSSKENQYVQLSCVTGGSELEKEGEASPTVQILEKDQGQSDISGLSAGPFVIENSSLLIREVLAETKHQQVEEVNLTPEAKSDLLVNLDSKSSITKDQGQADQLCLSSEPLEYSDDKEEGAYPAAQIPGRNADQSSLSKDHGQNDNVLCLSAGPFVTENSSLLVGEVLGEINNQEGEEENPSQKPTLLVNLDFEISNEIRCLVDERRGETEKRSVSPKNHHEKRDTKTISSVPLVTDSIDSFSPDRDLSEIIDDKENQTPLSICTAGGQPESEFCNSPPLRSEDKSIFGESIWERRGKPASAVRIQTETSRERTTVEAGIDNDNEQEVESITPDKENLTPNTLRLRSLKKKFEVEIKLDDTQEEQEIFTPDKENFTPNTLRLRSLKKKGKLELTDSKSHRSSLSKQNLNSNIPREDLLVSPAKENQKLKDIQERKSVETTTGNQARVEKKLLLTSSTKRMPFQSLLKSSAGKNSRSEASVPDVATKNSTFLACSRTKEKVKNPLSNKFAGERKRGWTMVADTNTLLHKESRKSLQLLQGLKGTHLIIPRMVIRELDCLKQRGSLFRKKTEACLVLEWIEECMVKTNWWIHVQSSLEDGRLIAPTPPASPQSLFSEDSWGLTSGTTSSFPFLRCRSSMELVSPAAEDHILDCALLHRKMSNEGQLVLLSSDITLKIKAMAEGLICETAQEFHESLVNPSSDRFMWAGSCPRGRTWSYLADIVLAEKYNRCQLKKSSRGEGAKGLKLILLHNSQYGQIH
ncbi:putative transcription factor interactor and regulator FHA-SMAD family [Rosa chinensis]|uniref:Putative transcription factor interactor and regulator FHA-SMAD family n=1 Tax=Rosa chinensis TaxID=74649 RepID=A0A2P6PR85_ROSCH|nr:FHA domain-containing protein PS1 [Rosa chinensis]PRQ24416.1 putative transcription factor interactor and regulator FHA-SMAD family [Rosa chinensis]